jgi:Uma2 family endonuclease
VKEEMMAFQSISKLYTFAEFEAFIALPENLNRHFELIHGGIVEKAMPTEEHGIIIHTLSGEIYIFLKANPIARAEIEVRYKMPKDDHNGRQPDLSVITDTNTPIVRKGAVPRMPDLAVEVKSPDDKFKDMRDKAEYYLANGTKIVWLIYPHERLVEVFRPNVDSEILNETHTLNGEDVLPGFTLAISELFRLI